MKPRWSRFKFLRSSISSQAGMSLVETMVAIGIMTIFISVFSQYMAGQSKQTKVLMEKMGLLELEKVAIGALSSQGTCSYIMQNPSEITMNLASLSPTNPIRIPVNRPIPANIRPDGTPGPTVIRVGDSALTETGRGLIQAINLVITEGSAGSYKGYWEIQVDQSTLTGRFKPIQISTVLTADVSNLSAATVESCMGEAEEAGPAAPTVRIATATNYAWRWPAAVASCNANEYVISGGGHCYNHYGWMIIVASVPTANGWYVACDSHVHRMAHVDVFAMCGLRE